MYTPIVNPHELTAEGATGNPDYFQAMMNAYKGLEAAQKPHKMMEEILKQQIENKYAPRKNEAEIGESEARTGLLGQQTKYFGPNVESEISLRNAQKGLYGAQAQQAAQTAALKKRMMELYFPQSNGESAPQPQPDQPSYSQGNGGPMYAQNMRNTMTQPQQAPSGSEDHFNQINQMQQSNRNAPYGIQSVGPSREDMASKMLFGIDTFGDKQKQNMEQINKEKNSFTKKSEGINSQLEASNKQAQLVDRYNNLMDETLLSGPVGSKVHLPTAKRQEIEQISRDMVLSGIEELKTAMGSAKFSNLDLETATARKPDITWSPEARREYTQRFKAFNKRLNEQAAFNQVASHPGTGISSAVADRLWSEYQKHHPLIADAKTLQLNKYRPNNWASYLTPEAINSVKQTGSYNPKDKGLIHDLTKTEQKIAEKYSLSDLEKHLKAKRGGKAK